MSDSDRPSAPPPPANGGGYRPGYEVAAERILEYVVREGLQPGTRLPTEKDLADEVGMSRTVVREAVKILSALGRLSVQKGRGIYVTEPEEATWQTSLANFLPADLRQVDEMFEYRRHLETTTANLAAQRATPAQVRAVREAARQTTEAAERGDLDAFTRADDAFHVGVATAASNMFFASTVDAIRRLQRQVTAIGLAGVAGGSLMVAADQHEAIAEAVAAGEPERAAALMAEHIDMTARQFQRAIWNRVVPDDSTS
ncbi:FCD domain-containing protein [Kitasatospora paracochleata]|uniref:DNA-binding FadR family transcriptional regulator n=1 Tax=Kitasatospora paracochleata TaxID=58354 RepID=A0ABT1IW95_9ACTN|nr:FadR/GntR family transcriptional regulator [Kitasatospora paracochleata]MCP2309397.1 DNA-binding FadR family transcriptional regulator [Kitasatospora paracochleata]